MLRQSTAMPMNLHKHAICAQAPHTGGLGLLTVAAAVQLHWPSSYALIQLFFEGIFEAYPGCTDELGLGLAMPDRSVGHRQLGCTLVGGLCCTRILLFT